MKDFNWENIGRIFDYLNGYSEGEHTLSFRYLDSVNFSQRDEIIQKVYYERYFFDYDSWFFSILTSTNLILVSKNYAN